jgi:hypothetical protein
VWPTKKVFPPTIGFITTFFLPLGIMFSFLLQNNYIWL